MVANQAGREREVWLYSYCNLVSAKIYLSGLISMYVSTIGTAIYICKITYIQLNTCIQIIPGIKVPVWIPNSFNKSQVQP